MYTSSNVQASDTDSHLNSPKCSLEFQMRGLQRSMNGRVQMPLNLETDFCQPTDNNLAGKVTRNLWLFLILQPFLSPDDESTA